MDQKGYWEEYEEGIQPGHILDVNTHERVSLHKFLSPQIHSLCKGNVQNAKILIASILRELFFACQHPVALQVALGNVILPLDSRGTGHFKTGAKQLLDQLRKHQLYLTEASSYYRPGILIADASSPFIRTGSIDIILSEELQSVEISCLNEFRALSESIVPIIDDILLHPDRDITSIQPRIAELIEDTFEKTKRAIAVRQQIIRDVWAEVFPQPIQWEKNYFANGGDSIQAIRFLSKLKEKGALVNLAHLLNAKTMNDWRFVMDQSNKTSVVSASVNSKIYSLSSMQRRIWDHYKTYKNTGAYHEQFLFELKKYPGINQIKACMQAIWKSYDQLRVVVREDDGQQMLHVQEADLSFTTYTANSIEEVLKQDAQIGFADSLLRISVIDIHGKFYLLWSHHHLLMDGWSVGILIQEFVQRMNTADDVIIPRRNIHLDVLALEQQYVAQSTFESSTLSFLPVRIPFSPEHPAPVFHSSEYHIQTVNALQEAECLSELKITRQLLFCGIAGLMLKSISSDDAFFFNSISSGRGHLLTHAEDAVGLLIRNIQVNFPPLQTHTKLSFFSELNQQFNHLLLHDLKDSLPVSEESEASDFLFIYENYPYKAIDSEVFSAELIRVTEITGYPVTFCLFPNDSSFDIRIVYDASKYSSSYIDDLKNRFLSIYTEIIQLDSTQLLLAPLPVPQDPFSANPDFLAVDFIEEKQLTHIVDQQLSVQTIMPPFFSDVFPKGITSTSKESNSLFQEGYAYWLHLLQRKRNGFWQDQFQRVKGSLSKKEALQLNISQTELLTRIALFLKHRVWNNDFEIVCIVEKIPFPLFIEAKWNEKEVRQSISDQLFYSNKYEKPYHLMASVEGLLQSNFLISFDKTVALNEEFDFCFILSEEDEWSVYSRNTISDVFINDFTHYINHNKAEVPPFLSSDNQSVWVKPVSVQENEITAKNVVALFIDTVRKYPEKIAVESDEQALTYAQLLEQVNRFATFLQDSFLNETTPFIGISLKRGVAQLIAVLSVLKTGKAFIPIDPDWPLERIQQIKSKVQLHQIIDEHLWHSFQSHLPLQRYADSSFISSESPAYCLFTSGSTGVPKGCVIPHKALSNYLHYCHQHYFSSDAGRVHVFTPLSFDFTLTAFLGGITCGATIVLHDPQKTTYDSLWMAMTDQHSSFIKLTPSHISILETEWIQHTSPKCIVVGGEALSSLHIDKIQAANKHQLINEYGPTETTVGCVVATISSQTVPYIGTPINGMGVWVLDEDLHPVKRGVEGELYLTGIGVGIGYLNDDVRTAQSFIQLPMANGLRAYRTGDIVRMQADGNLLFLHRKDGQLKLNGYRIETEEIRLAIFDLVRLHAVSTVVSFENGKQLVSFIEGKTDLSQLKEGLTKRLPAYMVPSRFIEVEYIPLTHNGKIDYASLTQPLQDSARSNTLQHSETSENVLSAISKWLSLPDSIKEIVHAGHLQLYGWKNCRRQWEWLSRILRLHQQVSSASILINYESIRLWVEDQTKNSLFDKNSNKQKSSDSVTIITGKDILSLAETLTKINYSLPITGNPILAAAVNHLVKKQNPSASVLSVYTLASINQLSIGSYGILKEWSEDVFYPIVLTKLPNGRLQLLSLLQQKVTIVDSLNRKLIDGQQGFLSFDKQKQFIAIMVDQRVELMEAALLSRFSILFRAAKVVEKVLIRFPQLKNAYFTAVQDQFILLYDVKEEIHESEIRQYIKSQLPVWCQPDIYQLSSDFNTSLEYLSTTSLSTSSTHDFELFKAKYLTDFLYLKGEYSLIEQGGDSITALRLIGRLKRNGFQAEMGALLNAASLQDYLLSLNKPTQLYLHKETVSKLTPIQDWFFKEYKGNRNHFNQSILLEILLPVDFSILSSVLQKALSNFSLLSMTYKDGWTKGNAPVVSSYECLTEEEVSRHCQNIQTSFNLERGPVAGAAVFKLQDQRLLFISIHHIFCDGYSWRLILDSLQQALQGQSHPAPNYESFGQVQHTMHTLFEQNATAVESFYGTNIQHPFSDIPPFSYSDSVYREWEWTAEKTTVFQRSHHLGKSTNERFLYLVLKTWMNMNLPPVTPFFETHGRSYTNVEGLTDSLGWFTQFYPVFTKQWPTSQRLIEEIASQFQQLPDSGLTYMAMPNWQRPPFPLLLNFLGNFDENRGTMAQPSSIDQGEMVCADNEAMGMVEINALIVQGKLKWMLRAYKSFPVDRFRELFEAIPFEIDDEALVDIDDSIAKEDIDAIGDLLNDM